MPLPSTTPIGGIQYSQWWKTNPRHDNKKSRHRVQMQNPVLPNTKFKSTYSYKNQMTNEEGLQLLNEVLDHNLAQVFVEPIVERNDLKKATKALKDAIERHQPQQQELETERQEEVERLADEYIYNFYWYRHENTKLKPTNIRRLVWKDFKLFAQHTFPLHVRNHTLEYIHKYLYLFFGAQ